MGDVGAIRVIGTGNFRVQKKEKRKQTKSSRSGEIKSRVDIFVRVLIGGIASERESGPAGLGDNPKIGLAIELDELRLLRRETNKQTNKVEVRRERRYGNHSCLGLSV